MGVISGTNLRIYNGTDPYGYATSCTLDMSAEVRETLSKDSVSSWAENEVGQLSATLSFEGFFSEDTTINSTNVENVSDLFGDFSGKTAVSWRFTTDATGEAVWSGSGYITSLSFTGNVEENATYSGTITVSGAITEADIT